MFRYNHSNAVLGDDSADKNREKTFTIVNFGIQRTLISLRYK